MPERGDPAGGRFIGMLVRDGISQTSLRKVALPLVAVRVKDSQTSSFKLTLEGNSFHAREARASDAATAAVGQHQHLTGLVQESQPYREMLEESRAAQSAAGPPIDRL